LCKKLKCRKIIGKSKTRFKLVQQFSIETGHQSFATEVEERQGCSYQRTTPID
jgi:hypothetical protein